MPTRDTPWPAGTPCWVDLSTPDLPKAVEFYSTVLGWTLVDKGEEFGHYHIAEVDGRAAAGIGPVMEEGQPSFWTVYLATEDADGTAKLITENGGSLLFEPMDVPGQGRMAIATDPDRGRVRHLAGDRHERHRRVQRARRPVPGRTPGSPTRRPASASTPRSSATPTSRSRAPRTTTAPSTSAAIRSAAWAA